MSLRTGAVATNIIHTTLHLRPQSAQSFISFLKIFFVLDFIKSLQYLTNEPDHHIFLTRVTFSHQKSDSGKGVWVYLSRTA